MSTSSNTPDAPLDRAAWLATVAGLSGSLVGIGLSRFAYTPLIPPLIEAHWFSAADAVSLGATNFAGYLAGALLGRAMARRLGNRTALRLMMLVATATFFACAFPLSLGWYSVWRFLSGLSGGAIMVLAATTILPHIQPTRRGFVSGMVFLGLGLGIAASGTLVPELLHYGLRATWIGLGVLAFVLTAVSWFGWPSGNPPQADAAAPVAIASREKISLRLLYVQYAANALGIVPAMVLLVNYIALGLGWGSTLGARFWVLYGLAAIAGPVLNGSVVDRLGAARAYRVGLIAQIAATGIMVATANVFALSLATIIFGIFTPGMVTLALGRIHEILPHDHNAQRAAWSNATTAFALFQMLGGYFYAWLFAHTEGDYTLIFLIATASMVFALMVNLADAWRERRGEQAVANPAD
ncbi:MAG: MFS transporter [Parvibaculum sp.]|uniref:YbfB/YjiJ family MFS transporter n=1 Tax=Parvibaculum sp. TaxID=2024848 RepID=UPI0025E1238F|nr:YbfB/YjiJ family MFS transporter [Parvibaculum sp.]MCE9650770.1 MFS transporter [Parvibaculum sp.]